MNGSETSRPRRRYSYPMAPKRVYWEVTRACPLACTACSVGAMPSRHPRELTTDEGLGLLDEIGSFSNPPPELVMTGGDPLCREDIEVLVGHAHRLGIDVVLWVSPTGNLTRSRLEKVKAAGARAIGLALDDVSADGHDRLHAPGTFQRTMEGIAQILDVGLEVHINTLVTHESMVDVPALYDFIKDMHIAQWNVFFLVPVKGTKSLSELNAIQAEVLMNWIYDVSRTAHFPIDVLEAPQYRRIVFQRLREAGVPLSEIAKTPQAAQFGLREGNGIVFVSHVGDVYPSPFFPLVAGNVRGRSLTALYRRSKLFKELRDPTRLKGNCARCQYRRICGGSRSRAYVTFNDWSVSDPLCTYEPVGVQQAF
ncbi:MAG: radical SAM protein [Firmicutes bacterium]|nr:radical SAM protein [Bacillota bacterium]